MGVKTSVFGPLISVLLFTALYWTLRMHPAHLAVTQQQMDVCPAGCWCLLSLLSGKVIHGFGLKLGVLFWTLPRCPWQSCCQAVKPAKLMWLGCAMLIAWRVLVLKTASDVRVSLVCGLHRAVLL